MHRRLPYSTKVKAFNTYLTTIFLYNSELWTLTETMVKSICIPKESVEDLCMKREIPASNQQRRSILENQNSTIVYYHQENEIEMAWILLSARQRYPSS